MYCVYSIARLQDPQGHFYTIRDLRIKFSEPSTDSPSPERMDQLLNDSVHWSETNLLDSSSKEPLMSIQNVEAPGQLALLLFIMLLTLFLSANFGANEFPVKQ